MLIIRRAGKHGGEGFTLSCEVTAEAMPSTTPRQCRAGHSPRRVRTHQCLKGLFTCAPYYPLCACLLRDSAPLAGAGSPSEKRLCTKIGQKKAALWGAKRTLGVERVRRRMSWRSPSTLGLGQRECPSDIACVEVVRFVVRVMRCDGICHDWSNTVAAMASEAHSLCWDCFHVTKRRLILHGLNL